MLNDIKINIKMLGPFSIEINGVNIQSITARSPQLVNLLQYLIAFRHKSITVEDLAEILWNEDIANPTGALKNLVYRIRSLLSAQGVPNAKDIILSKGASYIWNNSLDNVIDAEMFEKNCKLAENHNLSDTERILLYKEALTLYAGDFLIGNQKEAWILPIARYYQTMYFNATYDLLNILEKNKMYEQMNMVAAKAIEIDQYDELSHQYLLKTYMLLGKNDLVINYYNYINNVFLNEFGTPLSEKTTEIYNTVFSALNTIDTDFDRIKADIIEMGTIEGALCCDYAVFKQFYRFQARLSSRIDVKSFICLITLSSIDNTPPSKQLVTKAMDCLQDIIMGGLRTGDIFARFSATQYIIMLYKADKASTQGIITRLLNAFYNTDVSKKINIVTDFRPLDTM